MKKAILVVVALGLLVLPVVAWLQVVNMAPSVELASRQLAWLFGSLGFVLLFIQFVLSSRVRLFESDVGLDRMIHVHRMTGIVGLSLIFLHLCAVTVYELLRFGVLSLSTLKASGILAFLIVVTIAFAALFYKRIGWRY